ncbi:MAG TPA: hypothetical protein VMV91_03055 [Rhodocyclaceae bacterium]|nr:hypothetical protein [Rhodocyclaceae bacterium]
MGFLDFPGLAAHQQPLLGEMLADFLAAHLAAFVAVQIEVIRHAHDPRLRLVDDQLLFLAATAAGNVGDQRLIAKGRTGAIEEALPRVLLHGAGSMLRGFLALVLVKQIDDPAHHLPAGIVAGRLGDGNDLDFVLRQLALVDAELDAVTEEARQAVNDDGLERRRLHQGVSHHSLEHRPLVIGGGCARLDVLLHHQMPVGLGPVVELAQLVGNGQVIVGLPRGGDSGIDRYVHDALRTP